MVAYPGDQCGSTSEFFVTPWRWILPGLRSLERSSGHVSFCTGCLCGPSQVCGKCALSFPVPLRLAGGAGNVLAVGQNVGWDVACEHQIGS